jgi:ribosomal protein L16 Arg81 hydroxylase
MPRELDSLEAILDPLPVARFLAEYKDRRPLHLPGPADKFAEILTWQMLDELLNQDIWTAQSLQLWLDNRQVPPLLYCQPSVDRDRRQMMKPDPAKVVELAGRGASLLLHEVELLHQGPRRIHRALSRGLEAKVSINLYCSWNGRQAFDSHFDRHDVFALQIVGSKRWRLYEGRADYPVEHPSFRNLPQEQYDRMKGAVAEEVELTQGDLLYLPRGQLHDALATSEASIHLTVACTEATGLDWLTQIWERALQDSRFRRNLPRSDSADFEEALRALARRFSDLALDPHGLQQARGLRRGFGQVRPEIEMAQRRLKE